MSHFFTTFNLYTMNLMNLVTWWPYLITSSWIFMSMNSVWFDRRNDIIRNNSVIWIRSHDFEDIVSKFVEVLKELSCTCNVQSFEKDKCSFRSCHGHDRMVVGFKTTCVISAYHHWSCEYKPHWRRVVLDTILCDKVCQWLVTGRWFSLGTPVSSTNKTDHHDIAEIYCFFFFICQ